ncbi:MAG: chemotaxis protein CheW [Treponemataceae bacterium]|nr:chemotaxis protein CheW [Treponemataceae bacterium]
MAAEDFQFQLVTFRLGDEWYGVDIMDVKEIVKIQNIRAIPNAPYYMVGILNMRGEIIPIIDLHKRFLISTDDGNRELDELESGFIILNIENTQIGIIIDKVSRVISVKMSDVQEPPQMMSGIGSEYIKGVVHDEKNGYLIILNTLKLFDPKELQKIINSQ